MGPLGAVLILLVIFGSITSIILGLAYLNARNKERTMIIEKGIDPAMFKEEDKTSKTILIRTGIFLIGLAVGIIVGGLAAANLYGVFPYEGVSYFASIFLFGGISLLIGSYIGKSNKK